MKLYYHPASTTSRIVEMFAKDQGIDLDYQVVDLFTGEHMKPEYAKINPSHMVPVLEDGNFRLTESAAIIRYLADKANSPAYPKDLQARARVNEMMDWFNANMYKDYGYGLVYPQTFPAPQAARRRRAVRTLEWKQKTIVAQDPRPRPESGRTRRSCAATASRSPITWAPR
jgi:glutathione S-transferase